MRIQIYADGADIDGIITAANNPYVTGFTTNPTLMRKAGIADYKQFAQDAMLRLHQLRPDTNISLEVFADDAEGMIMQARQINAWAADIGYMAYVKIPITTTNGESTFDVVKLLTGMGVPCNITAVFTPGQVEHILGAIDATTPTIISVFAGRIADAGVNPVRVMGQCIAEARKTDPLRFGSYYDTHKIKFLWASTREIYNLIQADEVGCDIITLTPDLIKKREKLGANLTDVSLDTVKMFYNDACASRYMIEAPYGI